MAHDSRAEGDERERALQTTDYSVKRRPDVAPEGGNWVCFEGNPTQDTCQEQDTSAKKSAKTLSCAKAEFGGGS